MQIELVKLGEDGRLVLPASLRQELGLQSGDTLVIESDGDSLLLRRFERVLCEGQETNVPSCLAGANASA